MDNKLSTWQPTQRLVAGLAMVFFVASLCEARLIRSGGIFGNQDISAALAIGVYSLFFLCAVILAYQRDTAPSLFGFVSHRGQRPIWLAIALLTLVALIFDVQRFPTDWRLTGILATSAVSQELFLRAGLIGVLVPRYGQSFVGKLAIVIVSALAILLTQDIPPEAIAKFLPVEVFFGYVYCRSTVVLPALIFFHLRTDVNDNLTLFLCLTPAILYGVANLLIQHRWASKSVRAEQK